MSLGTHTAMQRDRKPKTSLGHCNIDNWRRYFHGDFLQHQNNRNTNFIQCWSKNQCLVFKGLQNVTGKCNYFPLSIEVILIITIIPSLQNSRHSYSLPPQIWWIDLATGALCIKAKQIKVQFNRRQDNSSQTLCNP